MKNPTASITFGLMLLLPGAAIAAQPTREHASVLFIAIDDLRPELGCYGADHIKSPHIDALASRGITFHRAYCQFPVCGPSRASLLSGLYPTAERFKDNNAWVEREASGLDTLPGAFRRAGYYTIGNGKLFHHLSDTARHSWSEPPFSLVNGPKENNHMTFHDNESAKFVGGRKNRGPFFEAPDVPDATYIDGQTCDKSIKDLRRLAAMDQPFFLACGFVRPHLPFYAPKKYWDLYDRETIELADNRYAPKNAPRWLASSREVLSYHGRGIKYNSTEFHRIARHGYYACVSYADVLVGRLMQTLDELEIRDNTVVVLWGDHGWHLGEHDYWAKNNLLHNALRAPLIISAPGFKRDVDANGIVELIDIYPTLCELAGIEPPSHLQGQSMVPLMRDPTAGGKEAALSRDTRGVVITTKDHLYAEYLHGGRMLFDRAIDPAENVNVAENSDYARTLARMRKLLAKRQAEAAAVESAGRSTKPPLAKPQ